jgi:hypothetical protein
MDRSFESVGVSGLEPPTPGPPDQYSNRTELHPEKMTNVRN